MNEDPKFENESVVGVPAADANGKQFDRTCIGSYVIIPKSHVATVFDLSEQEWLDTKKMIDTIKQYINEKYAPDGYNLGWNVGRVGGEESPYAHLHFIPRYKDEPYAGRGIRYWIKQEDNIRPSIADK